MGLLVRDGHVVGNVLMSIPRRSADHTKRYCRCLWINPQLVHARTNTVGWDPTTDHGAMRWGASV